MAGDRCAGCVCAAAEQGSEQGRLLLATRIDHSAKVLRSLARRHGAELRVLVAPGVLELTTGDIGDFLAVAGRALSRVESDEVRALVVAEHLDDNALLAAALSAPSLRMASSRILNADLSMLLADERNAFYAVYQPIVELATRRVVAYEALLRATGSTGAELQPAPMFAAAEDAGWTHVLDRVGRTTALRDAAGWLGDAKLFINFVPTSIYRPEICLRTTELAAHAAGLPLEQLVFEVTEGHSVRDVDHLQEVFAYYRASGCQVALDDLGSGYSTLNLLVRLQPDVVKLDREVVHSLPSPVGRAVVASVVDITHSYGGRVLAEGVETDEQSDIALDLGVDLGQGWLYGRPARPSNVGTASVLSAASA